MFFSPLEQFSILPLLTLKLGLFDISITNSSVILFLVILFFIIFFFSCVKFSDKSFYIVPTRYQSILESFYSLLLSMVTENVKGESSQKYFPFFFSIFFFIASLNLVGLVPYSFTVTSHFVVTFAVSLLVFIGLNIICIRTHGLKFFSLFLPSGTPLPLAFLLVPVEFFLYFFKPFSLSIRLFCNMMAGHILLKIFVGFAWSLMSFSGAVFLLHFIPLIILIPLFVLELAVAFIQAFVFSLLLCIYLNDAIHLH